MPKQSKRKYVLWNEIICLRKVLLGERILVLMNPFLICNMSEINLSCRILMLVPHVPISRGYN